MEDKKIVINAAPGVSEIILREGVAPDLLDPRPPVKVELNGVIGVPVEFLRKRLSEPDQIYQKQCHVIVSREKLSIKLVTNECNEYTRGAITGTLQQHPKFQEFGINTGKSWEPILLGQFFKMNRYYFPDVAENMKLVTDLKNYEAKIDSRIEKQREESGSTKDNFSQVVQSNLPGAFKLHIPLFKGREAETIEVEFYATVNGRNVALQLFSPGACQALEDLRDKVIDEQIEIIREIAPNIAIIEQ